VAVGTLKVDVTVIRAAANSLRSAAGDVPHGEPLDFSGCGSGAARAAAESFNMWAKVTGQVTSAKLTGAATDADNAARSFEALEANLAAAVSP
jgi:hypothetical protein